MIPTIEAIVEDLLDGSISKQQALAWLFQHAEGSANELRDHFAGLAMQGICASGPGCHMTNDAISAEAYRVADSMMKARQS
jgi:hypothetical protein